MPPFEGGVGGVLTIHHSLTNTTGASGNTAVPARNPLLFPLVRGTGAVQHRNPL